MLFGAVISWASYLGSIILILLTCSPVSGVNTLIELRNPITPHPQSTSLLRITEAYDSQVNPQDKGNQRPAPGTEGPRQWKWGSGERDGVGRLAWKTEGH